jgi:choline dehydrogenase-like flavoprotein
MPPPIDDMQCMFEIFGSDNWTWEKAQKKWNEIERFHGSGDIDTDYLAPISGLHGHHRPLDTGYPKRFEKRVLSTMQTLRASCCRVNPEPWNGTHLGISIAPSTAHRGTRTTTVNLLDFSLENLEVKTESRVHRLLVKDGKAFALTLLDRDGLFYASKEIILAPVRLAQPRFYFSRVSDPLRSLKRSVLKLFVTMRTWGEITETICTSASNIQTATSNA